MVVRLRLARHGTRNNPFYHVVAIRDKAARDARPIEKLGEYDPIPRPRLESRNKASSSKVGRTMTPERITNSGIRTQEAALEKRLEWNASRVQYWLGVGAQPSKPVARLLDKAGLVPEGKMYKGVYRPNVEQSTAKDSEMIKSASPSAILQAAGVLHEGQEKSEHTLGGAPASAFKQEETSTEISGRTDPKLEALKEGVPESSLDQAA